MIRITSFVHEASALAVAFAFGLIACAPTRYAYAPVTTTSAEIVGHPAAEVPFPPESPHGRVRLATFGIAQVAEDGPRYFHVRMSATADGKEPWVIERKEQVADIAIEDGPDRTARVAAATDVARSPARIEITPGTTGSIDLFFPLPPGAKDAAEVPAIRVTWTVHERDRAITMVTPFERFVARGPALSLPRPEPRYPYGNDVGPRRLPGTPDTRWPQPDTLPDTTPLPQPPSP